MTQRTNHQRCYDSNLRLMQQAQSNQRNTQQFQASQQCLQDKFQACQKHLQESYQLQRNLNNGYIYTYTDCDRSFRVAVWIIVKGMAAVLVMPVAFSTLSERFATKVVLSVFGCFVVSTAIECCPDRLPKRSLEGIDMIVMPEIEGESEKLAAEGYSGAIRSLLSKVACYCSSWFISQGKSASKLHF